MKRKITCFFKMLLIPALSLLTIQSFAQEHKVSGVITDASNGDPLIGVTVSAHHGTIGTVTSGSGKFVLNEIEKGDTLHISLIGYETKNVIYNGQTNLDIKLGQSSQTLSQLVVVGYGEQSRTTITSSVAKLNQEVLQSVPRSNIGTALQGALPGLRVVNTTGQPGEGPSVIMRGGASINSPGGPLVVVDGVIRPYNDIPAEDIKSIQLLKDAAATAIYGARADNGVLLITTKSGKAGKSQITYKFTQGFNTARRGYPFLDAKDYIYYDRLGNLNSGRSLAQVNQVVGFGLKTDPANLASFDIREYGPSTAYLLQKGWDTVGDPYGGTIIFKDHSGEIANLVFRNTHTEDHFLSATGGSDKGTYYTSFDYYKENGVIVGSNYKRFSGNINGSYKVKPNIEVSSGITASTSSEIGVNGSEVNIMYRTLALWPTFNPWLDSTHTKPNPGNSASDGNPLYWLGKREISNEVNNITAQAAITWDILPGLSLKGTGSGYYSEVLNQSFTKATQNYSQVFSTPPNPGNTTRPAYATYSKTFQQQYDALLSYIKSFGKNNLNLLLGAEYYDTKNFGMQVYGTQAPTDDIPTVNASTVFNPGSNYSDNSDYRIISQFGRLNYDYDQRYLLTLTFRKDGVSSLPVQHQFGLFPGMSAGWNIQREKLWQNSGISDIISTLKPRISYGVNGNVSGLGDYQVQGVYSSQSLYNGNAGFLNTGVTTPNLEWEKSKTTDVGLDIGFLQDRFTAILDYYDRKTSDLLTNLPLPSYTGFSSVTTNLGTFGNKGFEMSVTASIINQPNGFSWNVSANASYNKNIILQLPPNGQPNNRQGGFQIYDPKTKQLVWVGGFQQGQEPGSVYAFKELGIFKDQAQVNKVAGNRYDAIAQIAGPNVPAGPGVLGQITPGDVSWLDVDHNDTIDTRDQVYMGNINPKWTGGFSTTLAYKGFSLYAQFQFNLGNVIYNDYVARVLGNYQGTLNSITLQKDSWSPTNENTMIPKIYYADQVSAPVGKKNYVRGNNAAAHVVNSNNSYFYESGNYLACREITLSYNFAQSLLTKTKVLSEAKAYISTNNLFYIKKFSGPTPEPPMSGNVITGIYDGTYPTPRSFIFGVQVSF
ncbi:MAG: SusC/RagA family TonB-linked outer membrane protein [Chitinophagaceae bacterium]|nr:MAG: SusC/RagA family TonB-linked outer membrane protein [Chitinophagaceae bacterium]